MVGRIIFLVAVVLIILVCMFWRQILIGMFIAGLIIKIISGAAIVYGLYRLYRLFNPKGKKEITE
mgnify:CR=1 FL=1